MKNGDCKHAIKSSVEICFVGYCVNPEKENRAAHGDITKVDTCRCGATRKTNTNGSHVERGFWMY